MQRGYVKLWRRLKDSNLWLGEKFTRGQAWVDLLMLANHKDGGFRLRGIWVDVKRGQVGHSAESLAARWLWSRGRVLRFLSYLKTVQQIEQQKSNILSIISIVNYDIYQGNSTTDSTTDGTTERQQTDTNKNDKNEKNKEKVVSLPEWIDFSLWEDFKAHRKKLRKPMTPRAEELIIKKLDFLKGEGHNPKHLIMTAIERGWQSVFPPRSDNA